MKNASRASVCSLCISLAAIFLSAAAARAQDEVTPIPSDQEAVPPTPSDPALQKQWGQVEAARGRLSLAEDKYQDAQQALQNAPGSSEAKAAVRAAGKERDKARKELKKAESNWQRRVAEYSRRRPPTGEAVAALPTSTPTPVPLGGDVVLPTPVEERVPAPAPAPAQSRFEGSYSGEWVNETFGSRGPASAMIAVDEVARTFQVVLTLGGSVFGGGAPEPQTLTGSYDATGRTIRARSDLFGQVELTVSPAGALNGTTRNPANSLTLKGNATPEKIELTYVVDFARGGDSARGTLKLNRRPG